MKTNTTISLLAAAVLTMLAGTANAQILPVAVTGWAFDAIYGGGSDGVNADVGGSPTPPSPGYHYVDQTYANANGFGDPALPNNGTVHSALTAGTVFQFQPYTQNNMISVTGSSQTLTLVTPGNFSDISFLVNNLDGNPATQTPASFTLNFSSGHSITLTTSQVVPYWVGGNPTSSSPTETAGVALQTQPLEYNGGHDGTPIQFDEYDFALTGPSQWGVLTSVTIDGSTGNRLDVYAISGTPGEVPEPSTWAMMIAGLAFLGFRLRNNRNRAAFKI